MPSVLTYHISIRSHNGSWFGKLSGNSLFNFNNFLIFKNYKNQNSGQNSAATGQKSLGENTWKCLDIKDIIKDIKQHVRHQTDTGSRHKAMRRYLHYFFSMESKLSSE